MIDNLFIENIDDKYYMVTPTSGYLIVIPATEEERQAAAECGETAEDYITTVVYTPLDYDFTVNPMGIYAVKNN
jgi:hypothetical protein